MVLRAIYKRFQKTRARKICRLLGKFVGDGDSVLDLGMGNGLVAEQLRQGNDINVLGLDIEDHNITDIPLVINGPKHLPFKSNQFDVVLIISVLHHANNSVRLLTEAKRICKRNIIILEDVYSSEAERIFIMFTDVISNWVSSMNMPFNFHREGEWLSIFRKIDLELVCKQYEEVPWFGLFQRVLFVLQPQ
jgi:ubiquinone/menaquinone biosynthesis C-methylase UbiE